MTWVADDGCEYVLLGLMTNRQIKSFLDFYVVFLTLPGQRCIPKQYLLTLLRTDNITDNKLSGENSDFSEGYDLSQLGFEPAAISWF